MLLVNFDFKPILPRHYLSVITTKLMLETFTFCFCVTEFILVRLMFLRMCLNIFCFQVFEYGMIWEFFLFLLEYLLLASISYSMTHLITLLLQIHRRKIRAWQIICVLSPFVEEDIVGKVVEYLSVSLNVS